MARNDEDVLEGLRIEFESANAATSASVGLTALQSSTDTVQEDLAGDMANAKNLPEGRHQPHSLQ